MAKKRKLIDKTIFLYGEISNSSVMKSIDILLEMIDSKKQGKLAEDDFLRYAESKKREILSSVLGVDHEEEDDYEINHYSIMQKYKSQL